MKYDSNSLGRTEEPILLRHAHAHIASLCEDWIIVAEFALTFLEKQTTLSRECIFYTLTVMVTNSRMEASCMRPCVTVTPTCLAW